MTFAGLAFLSPWLLGALAALPVIYWLLRTVPPQPHRVAFPATRILVGLENKEKQPAKTPWWLTLIRMLAATLLILALAEPVLNPNRQLALTGAGPVVLVVDNGWASSSGWSRRTLLMERLITEAESQSRTVIVAPTAAATKSQSFRMEPPGQARSTAAALQPHPFAPDRIATADALQSTLQGQSGATVVWLADGLDHDQKAQEFASRLNALPGAAKLIVIDPENGQEPHGLAAGLTQGGRLEALVLRAEGGALNGQVHAFSARGQRLGEATFNFAPDATQANVTFEMPLELRNQVARIEIAGERSAGAVHLLDSRTQWHRIGLVSGASREQAQPLLAPLYYIERALAPFAELAKTDDSNLVTALDGLIKRNISVLILADVGTVAGEAKERLDTWVSKGGVVVRFAGPRLEKGGDDLLPVSLRAGGRSLGGALSWSTPQPIGPLTDDSIFAGLAVPADVLVTRQVLADPARLGEAKVWARLKDGTPLVTAGKRGEGQMVLFHVTANAEWSNLPLSGLFVEMLRRISTLGRSGGVSLGEGTATSDTKAAGETATGEVLAPLQTLDGFGLLKPPPPTAEAIAAAKIAEAKPSAVNPPGYYGPQSTPRALNLITQKTVLRALPALPAGVERRAYEGQTARPLKPQLLTAALSLLFLDILAVLFLQAGGMSLLRRPAVARAAGIAFAVALMVYAASPAHAQTQFQLPPAFGQRTTPQPSINPPPTGPDARDIIATGKVTFGYVVSGDSSTDQTSKTGLVGLNRILIERTAVEPGDPYAVNIDADEIAFFPILYWPVLPNARALPPKTLAKIDAYMKQGGLIIFDTKDQGSGIPSGINLTGREGGTPLQRLLGNLDIPRLEPVPEGHVLTKAFYLLRSFPGRWDGGQLWVEAEAPADSQRAKQQRRVDGVSSILVTSNDFAAAWALDDRRQPIYPTVPGGERQREMAYRTGVNIVMYTLTGNYKADQVHIPAILERLGQ
jgi:Domain of unknown function (DUF4159)/Aerotolerance regulator N-terminal